MGEAFWTLLALHLIVAAVLAADLVLRRKEPVATLAWLQGIFLLPVLGALLYLVFGAATIERRRFRRKRRVLGEFAARMTSRPGTAGEPVEEPPGDLPEATRETLAVAIRTSRRLPTRGNRVEVFENAAELLDELAGAVSAATRHVHLEYYIFQPDGTGSLFLERLADKASEGVEVRLLLDAVGSRRLTEGHVAPLLRAGGRVGWFLPLRHFPRRLALHLRNHRKIAVFDGSVAYTGGANIGDEYRGRRARKPSWRDTHLRVSGPAARQLQEVFAADWLFATGEELLDDDYYPAGRAEGDSIVQVVDSGPDDPGGAIRATMFHAIASARRRVWIETPYFVPDDAVATALATTARRGVDVRLILPERTDHLLVDLAGESFLPDLLDAGVHVFRYQGGMLHSKLVVVDGQWGTLGSANMDIRSFRFNFEVNLLVFSPSVAAQLEEMFEGDLKVSSAFTRAHVHSASLAHRVRVAACRALAPVL